MNSIVLDLQSEAYGTQVDISTLLRKAYVVARKLEIKEFEEWANNELNGYENIEDVPEYRTIYGEIKAWNKYHGWMPVDIEDSTNLDFLNKRQISNSVSSIESILEDATSSSIKFNLPLDIKNILLQGTGYVAEFAFVCPKSKMKKVLDSVRNIILKWTLDLEQKGVLGANMSFSEKEKIRANDIKYTTINHFNAEVSNSQIQQHTHSSTQINQINEIDKEKANAVLKDVIENFRTLDINEHQKLEIENNIKVIEEQLESPNLKTTKIQNSFKIIQSVLEGVSGSLIASGLIYQIQTLLN